MTSGVQRGKKRRHLAVIACAALGACTVAPDGPTLPSVSSSPVIDGTAGIFEPGVFPARATVGLPQGWAPRSEVAGDLRVENPGQVVEDIRVTDGTIVVAASDVTLRRVHAVGSHVVNVDAGTCQNGLVIEDSEFAPNGPTNDRQAEAVGPGGYTLRNVLITGVPEGIRVGGRSVGCGPVSVEHSYIHITSPAECTDWHGDGIQGYDGNALTVRMTTLKMEEREDCRGTAPFFYPGLHGNTSVDIDGLLVSGGGYPFRAGTPGTIRNLNVVDHSWAYGPVDVNCSLIGVWQAQTVTLTTDGLPVPVRPLLCKGS